MKTTSYLVKTAPIPNEVSGSTGLAVPPGANPVPLWIGTFSEHDRPRLVVVWTVETTVQEQKPLPASPLHTIGHLVDQKAGT